jgi:SanA protein
LKYLKKYWKWITAVFLLLVIIVISANYTVLHSSRKYIFKNSNEAPAAQAALVLGAMVYHDSELSYMTRDRADLGIALYKSGKVKKILVSGDHGHKNYDEVNTIRGYILKRGVPPEDVFMDHAGFNTYNSMYRARDIFKVRSMIICTQAFHLNRSVFLARSMNIEASGVPADNFQYNKWNLRMANTREVLARVKAWFSAEIFRPKPHFLGDPIPITGDGRLTEDK